MESESDPAVPASERPAAVEPFVARRRNSFYRLPQFRLGALLGWMLIAGGAAGWAKYHLDLAKEERAVLQELADAGCSVEAIKSYHVAAADGVYEQRRWYEPPFLERIRELRVSGDAPTHSLVRAASLPGVEKLGVRVVSWPQQPMAAQAVLGQRPPTLPPAELNDAAFATVEQSSVAIEGPAFDSVLKTVRDAWERPRAFPERWLMNAFDSEQVTLGQVYERYSRTLEAHDGERSLVQSESMGGVSLQDGRSDWSFGPDDDGSWRPLGRTPSVGRRPRFQNGRWLWEGPDRSYDPAILDSVRTIRRLDDGNYVLATEPIAGDGGRRDRMSFVVSESSNWLPLAARRIATYVDHPEIGEDTALEAYRYAEVDGRLAIAEYRLHRMTSMPYDERRHVRYAWDFDPIFADATFDARRFVGSGLADAGVYPFRWYWIPFVAGIAFFAVRFAARIMARLRGKRIATEPVAQDYVG